jgi:hypothetical protein
VSELYSLLKALKFMILCLLNCDINHCSLYYFHYNNITIAHNYIITKLNKIVNKITHINGLFPNLRNINNIQNIQISNYYPLINFIIICKNHLKLKT